MKKDDSPSRRRKKRDRGRRGSRERVEASGQSSSEAQVTRDTRRKKKMRGLSKDSDFLEKMGEVGIEAQVPEETGRSPVAIQQPRHKTKKKSPRRWLPLIFEPPPQPVPSTEMWSEAGMKTVDGDSGFGSAGTTSWRKNTSLFVEYELLDDEESDVIMLQKSRDEGPGETSSGVKQKPARRKVCGCMRVNVLVAIVCVVTLIVDAVVIASEVLIIQENPDGAKSIDSFFILIASCDMLITICALIGVALRKGSWLIVWELTRFFTMAVMLWNVLQYLAEGLGLMTFEIICLLIVFFVIVIFVETIGFMFIQELFNLDHCGQHEPFSPPPSPSHSPSMVTILKEQADEKSVAASSFDRSDPSRQMGLGRKDVEAGVLRSSEST